MPVPHFKEYSKLKLERPPANHLNSQSTDALSAHAYQRKTTVKNVKPVLPLNNSLHNKTMVAMQDSGTQATPPSQTPKLDFA